MTVQKFETVNKGARGVEKPLVCTISGEDLCVKSVRGNRFRSNRFCMNRFRVHYRFQHDQS